MANDCLRDSSTNDSTYQHMELAIPFPTRRHAEIAFNSLRVDKEPRRGGCTKELKVIDNKLNVIFKAKEARTLRVASNSFLDFLILVTETMEQFDLVPEEKQMI